MARNARHALARIADATSASTSATAGHVMAARDRIKDEFATAMIVLQAQRSRPTSRGIDSRRIGEDQADAARQRPFDCCHAIETDTVAAHANAHCAERAVGSRVYGGEVEIGAQASGGLAERRAREHVWRPGGSKCCHQRQNRQHH
jgi:hypothetical protein